MDLFRCCADDPVNHTDPTGLWGGPFPFATEISRFFVSLWNAGPGPTFDTQPFIGNASGRFAIEEGFKARVAFGDPNAGEAVRHDVLVMELTREFDQESAQAVATALEYGSKDPEDTARDLNNQLGLHHTSKSREDSVERARADWKNGWSARDKKDSRIPAPTLDEKEQK